VAGHAARHRVNGVFDFDAFLLEHVGHFSERMLGLRHRHAVAGYDDDLLRILHDEGGVIGGAEFYRARFATWAARSRHLATEAAEKDRDEGTVHRVARDV